MLILEPNDSLCPVVRRWDESTRGRCYRGIAVALDFSVATNPLWLA